MFEYGVSGVRHFVVVVNYKLRLRLEEDKKTKGVFLQENPRLIS